MCDALCWTGVPIQEIFTSSVQCSQNIFKIHHNLGQDPKNMSEDGWMHGDAQGDQVIMVSIGAEWLQITTKCSFVNSFIFSILFRIAVDPGNTVSRQEYNLDVKLGRFNTMRAHTRVQT